jgi:pyruvate formate lyase activating enzyme
MNDNSKGVIFDIKKYAIHDGPGIRTTVFFKGCPLSCLWCHNPESRYQPGEDGPGKILSDEDITYINRLPPGGNHSVTVDQVMKEIMKDEVFYSQSGGGATFSGGEPMAQIDFLVALLAQCRIRGVHTVVDTCGFAPREDFDRVFDLVDLFLFDLKIMDDDRHVEYTGVSNKTILSNLSALASRGEKVIVRIPLVPEITDSNDNMEAIVEYLDSIENVRRLSLLPYNKLGEDKARRFHLTGRRVALETQDRERLAGQKDWLETRGYEVKIGG